MRVITEPTVTVLAIPRFYPHPQYKLPPHINESEKLIAHAGKGCYDSYGEDGRAVPEHVKGHIAQAHGSVLEHVVVSLFIEGISRGCSHEIVRHRLASYSQRSTRYTSEEDAAVVLEPYYAGLYERWKEGELLMMREADLLHVALATCSACLSAYAESVKLLIDESPDSHSDGRVMTATDKRKWARGKARQLLPHALETRMTMTANLRTWRFFIEQRSSRYAEPEIRRLAGEVFDALAPLVPSVFEDYSEERVDGFREFTTPFRKV